MRTAGKPLDALRTTEHDVNPAAIAFRAGVHRIRRIGGMRVRVLNASLELFWQQSRWILTKKD